MRMFILSSISLTFLHLSACGGGRTIGTGGQGGEKTCANGACVQSCKDAPNVPCIADCPIFPPDSPWNTRISDPEQFQVHPNWQDYKSQMHLTTPLHPDWGDWSVNKLGIPWQAVPSNQPLVAISFDVAAESDPGPYPFPPDAKVEPGDGHVLVLQKDTCVLWEAEESTFVNPGWHSYSGAKFDLKHNTLRTECNTSADAAGLPIFPGLVKFSEVQAGVINHAIRFTMNNTGADHIHPATHDSASSSAAWVPPMGLRLRLSKDFDMSKFADAGADHQATVIILTALKEYGIILADNGSDWFISGDSDDGWTPDLVETITQDLQQVHGSDFEAVYTGDLVPHMLCH